MSQGYYLAGVNGNLSKAVQNILEKLRPVIEKWSKQSLSKNGICYGFRRYLFGSQLGLHVDRLPTHILSVILQASDFHDSQSCIG